MNSIYEDGTYLEKNQTWHEEDSPWKARKILEMMTRNSLKPATICEVGCGAGEILNQLSLSKGNVKYFGYDISPQAFAINRKKAKSNLSFFLQDPLKDHEEVFDIVLAMDVVEHVENYFDFLRKLKDKGNYKILHIPLDLSVRTVLRSAPIINRRNTLGHIHYFTKETALETLKDTGYEVIDYFYTAVSIDRPSNWKVRLMSGPRRFLFLINQDIAVRIMGGWSLLVLAK